MSTEHRDCPAASVRRPEVASAMAVLGHWPQIGDVSEAIPVVAAAFSGARVFRVITGEREFALRHWPPGGLPVRRIRELHRFLAFVQGEGITEVAVPLTGRNGTLLESPLGCWQLEPWKPGVADLAENPTDVRLANAMRLLARFHSAASRYVASDEGTNWFFRSTGPSPAVEERLISLRHWNGGRLRDLLLHNPLWNAGCDPDPVHPDTLMRWFDRVAPAVQQELRSVRAMILPLHPCLRDIWSEHVLFCGEAVTGLIDANAARTENVASDLSRLLGSVLGGETDRWERAMDDYAAARPLSPLERRLILILDRSGVLLSTLHWIERAASEPEIRANARAAARFRTLCRRLEELTRTRIRPV